MTALAYDSRSGRDVDVFSLASVRSRALTSCPEASFRPHEIGFYVVVFYEETEPAFHWVDEVAYPVRRGAVVSVAPGQVHAFPAGDDVNATVVAFTEEALNLARMLSGSLASAGVFSPWLQSPLGQIGKGAEKVAQELLVSIDLETRRIAADTRQEVLMHLFTAWVLLSGRYRTIQRKRTTPGFSHLLRFVGLVEEKCMTSRRTRDYARWTGLSDRQLRRVCDQHLQRTPKEMIAHATILKLKRRLITGDAPIKAIASDFGFDDHSSLARYFRRHTGESPAAWQKAFVDKWLPVR